jgi:uncharacterized protein
MRLEETEVQLLKPDPMFVENFVIVALHIVAGSLLFIYIINRKLSRMRSLGKRFSLVGFLISFTLGAAMLGWWMASQGRTAGWWRWAFPFMIFLFWTLGDLRLVWQRYHTRGAPPDEHSPPPRSGLAFLLKPNTTSDLHTATYVVNWPGPDLKLVHLSDLHLNHSLSLDFYQQAIEMANQLEPDLVFLSGDFVSARDEIPFIPPLLKTLRTTDTIDAAGIQPGKALFASLGNHDYWSGPERIQKALDEAGVNLLSGNFSLAKKKGNDFWISADDRPWGPAICPPPEHNRGTPGLVLSHSPDNIYSLVQQPDLWAVFSGHVHAGQFRLPLPWGSTSIMLPSIYGRRFDHGHFSFPTQASPQANRVHLFVSAGIGAAEPPLRLYCPPEILVVHFKSIA